MYEWVREKRENLCVHEFESVCRCINAYVSENCVCIFFFFLCTCARAFPCVFAWLCVFVSVDGGVDVFVCGCRFVRASCSRYAIPGWATLHANPYRRGLMSQPHQRDIHSSPSLPFTISSTFTSNSPSAPCLPHINCHISHFQVIFINIFLFNGLQKCKPFQST